MIDYSWGYEDDRIISTDGCAFVSVTMANLYLNHNSNVDPVKAMRFATQQGFRGDNLGIKSESIPTLCEEYDLNCVEYRFDTDDEDQVIWENRITEEQLKNALDKENTVILASMAGLYFGNHAIIIRGYDENGFYINDPDNEEYTSNPQTFEIIQKELYRYCEITAK